MNSISTPEPSVNNEHIANIKKQKLELTKLINQKLKKDRVYFFRPVAIDGVYCYPVIYGGRHKIVNFEAINIKCFVKKGNAKIKQQYSLLYNKYKTIMGALNLIEEVVKSYKIYNGDLVGKKTYDTSKLEEIVVPYTEDQTCCVCNENTTDITVCKHHICLQCREQCLLNEQLNCPVCRKEEILNIYCNESNLINNNEYHILQYAFDYEMDDKPNMNDNISDDDEYEEVESEINNENNIITDNENETNETTNENETEINYNERTPEIIVIDENTEDIRQRMHDAISHYSQVGFQNNRMQTQLSYNITNVTLTRGSSRTPSPVSNIMSDILEEGELIDNDRYFT